METAETPLTAALERIPFKWNYSKLCLWPLKRRAGLSHVSTYVENALALAAALAWAAAVSAFPVLGAGSCDGVSATVVLNSDPGKVVHRAGHTRSDLKRIQERHGGKGSKRGWYPLGLTQAELRIDMRLGVRVIPVSANRFCAAPVKVEVTAGFTTFVIYIDRKYRRGGCNYRAILDHEDEHVAIYRDTLRRYAPWIEERLVLEVRRLRPVYVGSQEGAADRVKKLLMGKLRPLVKKMETAAELANAEIDTVTSYRAIHAKCRKW